MQQADASPPPEPAKPQIVEEQIARHRCRKSLKWRRRPEQKTQPTPLKPEPRAGKNRSGAEAAPVKPKVVRAEAKKPTETPPAPRNTAAPRAERQAPAASAISAGASAAVMASYNQLVAAHLQRFKEYPPGAKVRRAGNGKAKLQSGPPVRCWAAACGIVGACGPRRRDMAMVRRAQPFPGFPPENEAGLDEL